MSHETIAYAKINLALHILARREDGFHEVDSLVVFADFGDRVIVSRNKPFRLVVRGRFAHDIPDDESNLAAKAALLAGVPRSIGIELCKCIPVGAGLGGGSADAAAVMTLLNRDFGCSIPDMDAVAKLGADVPVCLAGRPARVAGIGERIAPLHGMPSLPLVLVNPGAKLDTAAVYRGVGTEFQRPLDPLPDNCTRENLCDWICCHENGLLPSASRLAPEILEVLHLLTEQAGCRAAAMSGSGATCFGAFCLEREASLAAKAIARQNPKWWVRQALTMNCVKDA